MKILFVFNSSYPIGAVSTHRTHNLAKGLVSAGAEVELIVAHPTEKLNHVLNLNVRGNFEGVNYKYISKSTIRRNNFILRKLTDFICHLKLFIFILINRLSFDALIVIGPSFDFRLFLPLAAKISGLRTFIEINEYPFVGKSDSIYTKFKRWIFLNLIIPQYDGHIVISENLKKEITKYKSRKSEIIKIPIISDNLIIEKITGSSPFLEPYIFHAGSLLENKDGILGILEAFGIAVSKLDMPLKYVFTGKPENSPHFNEIINLIEKYNLEDRIIFTGYISNDDISRYFSNASLAIINKYDTLQNRYCFATKLTEYIRYGIPVITTNIGESQYYLLDGFNAYIVECGNIEKLSEKIIFALTNSEKSNEIAKNALVLAQKDFNFIHQGTILYKFIESKI